jgi:hypothetical protein
MQAYWLFVLSSSLKTGGHMDNSITLTSAWSVRLVHSPAAVLVAIFLLGSYALPQSDFEKLGMSANELARRVVSNELKFQNEDHARWMYRLEKEDSEKKQVEEILETNIGSLSRLLSIDGHSLDDKQQQKENLRLQRLVSHPAEQRKLQLASNKKAEQGERLFKMLPDLFMFDYVGRQGVLVTLSFRPNPSFQPRSIEALVFHNMQGKMTVDIKQERLAAINGHLMDDVKFGAGLLGHLDKGGKFDVRQAEVAPGQWEMTALGVDIKGKALLFKAVGAHETETHSGFHRMPDNLTLAEAADILNAPVVEADSASHRRSGVSQELGAEHGSASQTVSLESRR